MMSNFKALAAMALVGGLSGSVSAYFLLQVAASPDVGGLEPAVQSLADRVARLEMREPMVIAPDRSVAASSGNAAANGSATPRAESAPAGSESRAAAFGRRGMDFDFRELMDPNIDPQVRLARARELLNSTTGPARLMAARVLVELDDPGALQAVQDLVDSSGGDRRAQRMAAGMVDMLGDMQGPAVDAKLYEFLLHDSKDVQVSAARQLEYRGDGNPMAQIVDEIAGGLASSDGGARSRAAQELGRTRSASAVAPLSAALGDNNSEVRLRAAQGLGWTGDESAVQALTAALQDPVAEVRSAASRSLDQIRNPGQMVPAFGRASSVFGRR